MKKKVRQITVVNQNYVWWYGISKRITVLYLSPATDKTNIVRIEFAKISDVPDKKTWGIGMSYAEKVSMTKGGEQFEMKIISPKMVSMLITYLVKERPEVFDKRREITFKDGYALLSGMGYTKISVELGIYC